MDYAIDLKNLSWNKGELLEIMFSRSSKEWINESNRDYPDLKYVNKYLRVSNNRSFEKIYTQYPDLELKPEYTFFMELSPGVLLAPHRDNGRSAAINFPLLGDWTKTPVRFHNTPSMLRTDLIYEHFYNPNYPCLINTSVYHSVKNTTSDIRYMLSISVHKPWEEIKQILKI